MATADIKNDISKAESDTDRKMSDRYQTAETVGPYEIVTYDNMSPSRNPNRVRINAPVNTGGQINPAFSESSINYQSTNNNDSDHNKKTPVYQVLPDGRTVVQLENTVTVNRDGIRVIVTSQKLSWKDRERVIKEKDLKYYKIFAIISVILFFPFGIPALIFAIKAHREFYEGLEKRGEIDTARKYAKRSEKFIILSVMCCILLIVIIVAIIEKSHGHGEPKARVLDRNRIYGRPLP